MYIFMYLNERWYCVQIISSSTPCGEFFFCSYHSLKSQQRVDVASVSSRNQHAATAAGASCDIGTIVKQCNELDLNIIIIWKVNHLTVLVLDK